MATYSDLLFEKEESEQYLNEDSVTPLHFAVFKNQLHHVKYHIKCLNKQNISLDFRTISGNTSLLLACKLSSVDDNIPKILVEAGANVNITDKIKRTPLHAACANGKVDVAKLLLRAGASVNSVGGFTAFTPLHCAVWAKSPELVELLLDAGADANIEDVHTEIPLLYNVFEPETYNIFNETVEKLVSVTTNLNCTDVDGETILMKAAEAGNKKLISLLIKYGADVNYNEKAIEKALSYNHIEIVKMLWNLANIETFNEKYTDFYYDLVRWSWNQTKPEQVECFYEIMNTPGVILHPTRRYLYQLAEVLTDSSADYDTVVIEELFESRRDTVYKITKTLLEKGAVFLDEDLQGLIYLCQKYHRYNHTEQEIKLLHLLVDNNVDISSHIIYFSLVNYPQFTLTLLQYCVLCDPIDVFKYFIKIRRIIDVSLLNLIKNTLMLCSPSEELRFQCFLNIHSLSDSREYPERGRYASEELEVPVYGCTRDSELDYELCEDVLDLLLLNRVPTLLELSRDKIRQHLQFSCVGGTTAYLQSVNSLELEQILQDIIQCKVIVNLI